MKPTNKALADGLKVAFKTSFADGEKMMWENIGCIIQDPDVLSGALDEISCFDVNKNSGFFEAMIDDLKPQNKNIYLYLFLPVLVRCMDMNLKECRRYIGKWMLTCCKMSEKNFFRVYEHFFAVSLDGQKAFLQGIRRAVEYVCDSNASINKLELYKNLYNLTQRLWECGRYDTANTLEKAMAAVCSEDSGFFDWMCSTMFAPVIRCQPAVFGMIAADKGHSLHTIVKGLLPASWKSTALLYRKSKMTMEFTKMKAGDADSEWYVKSIYNWGAQITIQLQFAKVFNGSEDFMCKLMGEVSEVITKKQIAEPLSEQMRKKLQFLHRINTEELPIQMDVAVGFAAVVLDAQIWKGETNFGVAFSKMLAYFLMMKEPAIDWLLMRFLVGYLGTANVDSVKIDNIVGSWKLLGYYLTPSNDIPYMTVKNVPQVLEAEWLPVYPRNLEKGQGEDFVNDIQFLQRVFDYIEPKNWIAQDKLQQAKNQFKEYTNLRNNPESTVRSYVLSENDVRLLTPFCIKCDFNHLLFPAMQESLEIDNWLRFVATVSYLYTEDAFVPLVLDTQILKVVIFKNDKPEDAEKDYIQRQINALKQLLAALYKGIYTDCPLPVFGTEIL